MDFPMQGKLMPGVFSDILIGIYSSKFTGTLGLTKKNVKKIISFTSGKPVSSRSNILKESLGAMLLDRGRITQEQLANFATATKEQDGVKIGEVMVAAKAISHLELEQLLKEQLLNRIGEVFFWQEGDYKIVEGKLAEKERVSLDENLPQIIYLISKKANDIQAIRKFLSSGAVPVKAGGNGISLDDLKVSGKELAIYRGINGNATVENIVLSAKCEENFVLSFLYALVNLGLISVRPPEGFRSPEPREELPPPKKKTEAPVSDTSKALFAKISEKLAQMKDQSYFQYFGLEIQSDPAAVKEAYFELAKIYHPDRFPKDFTVDMRKSGEKLFSVLTEAYNVLTDSAKREEYMDRIQLKAQGINQSPTQIAESEMEFRKGQILMKKADFDGAIEFFKRAIALYPEEAEYYVHLGYAMFRKGAKTKSDSLLSEAKLEIEKGLEKNESLDRGYLYLGHIAKFKNDMAKAKVFFQRAFDVNPNCLEAASELRLINSRNKKH